MGQMLLFAGGIDCWDGVRSQAYSGTINKTTGNITCQTWNEQYPHEHSENNLDEQYPCDGSIDAALNYCRDPDLQSAPWCYTVDSLVRWDYCPVPNCETLRGKLTIRVISFMKDIQCHVVII